MKMYFRWKDLINKLCAWDKDQNRWKTQMNMQSGKGKSRAHANLPIVRLDCLVNSILSFFQINPVISRMHFAMSTLRTPPDDIIQIFLLRWMIIQVISASISMNISTVYSLF